MFRLAFISAVVLLLLVQSLFDTTVHVVNGGEHVFVYGWVAWLFAGLYLAILVVAAWFAWAKMHDRIAAGLMLLGVPLVCVLVLPQILHERVVLTQEALIHRREPPHTKYNAEIPWQQIAQVNQNKHEAGMFSTSYVVSYEIRTKDGEIHSLPNNTVLSAASETIDAELLARGIPLLTKVIPRP